jgi:hypothetical protein
LVDDLYEMKEIGLVNELIDIFIQEGSLDNSVDYNTLVKWYNIFMFIKLFIKFF